MAHWLSLAKVAHQEHRQVAEASLEDFFIINRCRRVVAVVLKRAGLAERFVTVVEGFLPDHTHFIYR